jgi:hypothetical protein
MNPNYQVLLIAVVFASQIAVLSFFVPIRWQQYHALLFKRYPRDEYPRLHPLPREDVERKLALFRPMHLVIGAAAILMLAGGVIYADSARGLAGLMVICLLAQLLPLYVALPLAIRIKQASRSMPPPSPRAVELRKWRATDFLSPVWIGLGLAAAALAVACAVAVYLYRPNTLGLYINGFGSAGMLVAMILTLRGMGNLTVSRADPYMSDADTFRVRQRNYRSLFVGGAGFGVYGTFMLLYNAGLVMFEAAYLLVAFSFLIQLQGLAVVLRQNKDLNTRDFSVYRANTSPQAAR